MTEKTKLTSRESIAIDIIKAIAIFSVIVAHTVSVSNSSFYAKAISLIWGMFARIGVPSFLIIGGFFYYRTKGDFKTFWHKKFFRIVVPWLVCSAFTYITANLLNQSGSFKFWDYIKWIFGSGTWYYYFTIYTFFIFVFKWFCNNDKVLYGLIVIQVASLLLNSVGISTPVSFGFFTDYLNPLNWIGYFSAGILIRKYRLDIVARKSKNLIFISLFIMTICAGLLLHFNVATYFHILTSIFAVCMLILIFKFAYSISKYKIALPIRKIGASSYCIYLLHMQIVQKVASFIPVRGALSLVVTPFAGLLVMVAFVFAAGFVCDKIPFGKKIKMLVGLQN